VHFPFAVCASNETLTFFQSNVNKSGSILADHVNVVRMKTHSYEVRGITPFSSLRYLGLEGADILKLDIKGVEYEFFQQLEESELIPFGQIFRRVSPSCLGTLYQVRYPENH